MPRSHRHILTLFGGIVPRKASAALRDGVTQVDALIAAMRAPHPTMRCRRETALTNFPIQWLVLRGWEAFLDAKAEAKLADSFKRLPRYSSVSSGRRTHTVFAYQLAATPTQINCRA
ncbi:hypothetical protein ACNKHQ_17725 [Shigella flexneri]